MALRGTRKPVTGKHFRLLPLGADYLLMILETVPSPE